MKYEMMKGCHATIVLHIDRTTSHKFATVVTSAVPVHSTPSQIDQRRVTICVAVQPILSFERRSSPTSS